MSTFLRIFWRSMKHHKGLLTILIIVTLLLSAAWVIEPLYGRYAVDTLMSLKDGADVSPKQIIGWWLGVYATICILLGIRYYLIFRMSQTVLAETREHYYKHLLELDINHHVQAKTGELMKKIDNAADVAVDFSRQLIIELGSAFVTSSAFFAISFCVSWKLTLIAIPIIFVYIILLMLSLKITRPGIERVNRLWTVSIGRGYDTVANIFTVKSSGAEQAEVDTMAKLHREGIAELIKYDRPWAVLQGINFFMLLRILLISTGILMYVNGEISLGSVFFYNFGFFRMMTPLEMINNLAPRYNEQIGKLKFAEEVLATPIAVQNPTDPIIPDSFEGRLEFKNVSFSYSDADAISGLNLIIEPGEHVALVGHSGAGKSTMAMLINRFYDIDDGELLIDGTNIKKLDMYWWRRQIGLVQQENIMFNDTVLENIRYSRPEASDEEVMDAAKRAHAHDFINKFPEGYDTMIGERGIRLSGGERQRVAIARAILKAPKLVVLDEATSALDSKTEAAVQDGIKELMTSRTAVIIAHRLSTVRSVDRIAVLQDGKLIAVAPHEELMETCDVYREMVELQSHGMLAE